MRHWFKTAGFILASLALYVALFAVAVHRPLRIGPIYHIYQSKIAYANSVERPKIVVSAGSSGLYGVRCQLLERTFRMPCVNMSIQMEMGMMGILEFAKRAAEPGDVVLLPLEYGVYSGGGYGDTLRQYAVAYDHDLLFEMPLERIVWSLFYFDLKYLLGGLVENWMYYVEGQRHPWEQGTGLTRQGDARGHTPQRAARYENLLQSRPASTRDMHNIDADARAFPLLEDFFRWAKANNVRVIGTLPPTFDTGTIDEAALAVIKNEFRRNGETFVVLDNHSLYPVGCFYDTPDHLNEVCQAVHTTSLAQAIAPVLQVGEGAWPQEEVQYGSFAPTPDLACGASDPAAGTSRAFAERLCTYIPLQK